MVGEEEEVERVEARVAAEIEDDEVGRQAMDLPQELLLLSVIDVGRPEDRRVAGDEREHRVLRRMERGGQVVRPAMPPVGQGVRRRPDAQEEVKARAAEVHVDRHDAVSEVRQRRGRGRAQRALADPALGPTDGDDGRRARHDDPLGGCALAGRRTRERVRSQRLEGLPQPKEAIRPEAGSTAIGMTLESLAPVGPLQLVFGQGPEESRAVARVSREQDVEMAAESVVAAGVVHRSPHGARAVPDARAAGDAVSLILPPSSVAASRRAGVAGEKRSGRPERLSARGDRSSMRVRTPIQDPRGTRRVLDFATFIYNAAPPFPGARRHPAPRRRGNPRGRERAARRRRWRRRRADGRPLRCAVRGPPGSSRRGRLGRDRRHRGVDHRRARGGHRRAPTTRRVSRSPPGWATRSAA